MTTKDELCREEDSAWQELMGVLESLTPEEMERPGYFPEGWSVKDLMAHIASWQAEAGAVLEQIRWGTRYDGRVNVDEMNRRFYEANKDLPLAVVKAELWAARTRMITEFGSLADGSPGADQWFRESGAEHYREHLPRLEEWVKELRPGGHVESVAEGRAPRRARRLGVMGGTFDPIHYGHLVTAEEALHQFDLDEVVFVPTGQPWMKSDRAVSPPEDRYLMTVIATASNPRFSVSRIEVDREGPTYTVETLAELRSRAEGEVELFFVTGADAMLEILQWKDPEEVLSMAHFIPATRPGYDIARFEQEATRRQRDVSAMDIPALAISSTNIRWRVKMGMPVRYLVPDGVKAYIEKGHLYREHPADSAPGGGVPRADPPLRPGKDIG
jgi:nicotinate-nucleotide adenylyltransferase